MCWTWSWSPVGRRRSAHKGGGGGVRPGNCSTRPWTGCVRPRGPPGGGAARGPGHDRTRAPGRGWAPGGSRAPTSACRRGPTSATAQREWLLPGAHTPRDGEGRPGPSNPAFVDALLLGMNTQTLGEPRWRGLSVASGGTPLRRFWDAHRSDAGRRLRAGPRTSPASLRWVGLDARRGHGPPGRAPRRRRPHRPDAATPRPPAGRRLLHRPVPALPEHARLPRAPRPPRRPGTDADVGASEPHPAGVHRPASRSQLVLFAFPVAAGSARARSGSSSSSSRPASGSTG